MKREEERDSSFVRGKDGRMRMRFRGKEGKKKGLREREEGGLGESLGKRTLPSKIFRRKTELICGGGGGRKH